MGEKIKILNTFKFKKNLLEVELNSNSSTKNTREVHLQSKDFRLEMSESEFNQFATTIMLGAKNLKKLKKL